MRRFVAIWLACAFLLLTLSACGNKGPLVPPEEEQKKTRSESS